MIPNEVLAEDWVPHLPGINAPRKYEGLCQGSLEDVYGSHEKSECRNVRVFLSEEEIALGAVQGFNRSKVQKFRGIAVKKARMWLDSTHLVFANRFDGRAGKRQISRAAFSILRQAAEIDRRRHAFCSCGGALNRRPHSVGACREGTNESRSSPKPTAEDMILQAIKRAYEERGVKIQDRSEYQLLGVSRKRR